MSPEHAARALRLVAAHALGDDFATWNEDVTNLRAVAWSLLDQLPPGPMSESVRTLVRAALQGWAAELRHVGRFQEPERTARNLQHLATWIETGQMPLQFDPSPAPSPAR